MGSNSVRYLDQAHDRLAFYFEKAAGNYEGYLEGEYARNREAHALSWQQHYDNMRKELLSGIKHVIEDRGVKRKEMNMAVVGPGFHPTKCDLDERLIEEQLTDFNAIVLIDFSQRVLADASADLIRAGISPARVYRMQFDITNGIGTTYMHFMEQTLNGIDTEEELNRRLEETLDPLKIMDLRERLTDEKKKAEEASIRPSTTSLIGGGINTKRTMKLSVEGEDLPLHLVVYSMVLAGTGASAEHHLWSIYDEARQRTATVTQAVIDTRRGMFERIFRLISNFNTEVAAVHVRKMLEDNPDAFVISPTDITTICKEPSHTFDRINKQNLKEKLERSNPPIDTSIPHPPWIWHDEDEHSHEVTSFQFSLKAREPIVPHADHGSPHDTQTPSK